MRTCTDDTVQAIEGWQWKTPPGATWLTAAMWDAQHGKPMSLNRENRMRAAIGLDPLPCPVIVTPCPDCGSVHTGRCNGINNPVVVVRRQRREPPAWVVEATANLAALLERKLQT